jgi:hypothetical protein
LPTNNRLGWKGLPWKNTPAYYENLYNTILRLNRLECVFLVINF